MALTEVKNTLNQNDTMPTLKLENEHYGFTIFYNGDYFNDRCDDHIDPHLIKVRCKPKNSDIIIAVNNLSTRIDMTNSFMFDIRTEKDLDTLEKQLRNALDAMKDLQTVLDTYFA